MMKVCFRKRSNNRRFILWNLLINMTILFIAYLDDATIGFQFAQKIYHWNVSTYSYNSAIMLLISAVMSTVLPAILIHKLHYSDTALSIVGSASYIISMTILGGYLKPAGFFLAKSLRPIMALLSICTRSILSRIIDNQETGQIFSLLACIESIAPTLGTFIYSSLFNATIATLPGAAHHMGAVIMFYPFIVSLWLSLTRKKWDPIEIKLQQENNKRNVKIKSIDLIDQKD
ncbi:solute carrier family 46 member 3-like [Panonychus citri]|uniref:solute carrier family 46 member 3-like n=1 Tax=Panonychus citri TaxID=50023 RepID=UPI00230734B4|nr:solute carrier family 46 member 3-like [Panonychus citri]